MLTFLAATVLSAAEYRGQVTFNGLPVPGAVVTSERDGKSFTAISDPQGRYVFTELADGPWTVRVDMSGFDVAQHAVTVAPGAPEEKWELKLLPLDQMRAQLQRSTVASAAPAAASVAAQKQPGEPAAKPAEQDQLAERADDGLLINGSLNNGAASPFSQSGAFGNHRFGGRSYTGSLGLISGNSALDARPFSLTGQDTPKPDYNHFTGVATLGGPLRIPNLLPRGPMFFVGYQWTRENVATTDWALMPDTAERQGILSTPVRDPQTGSLFSNNVIPTNRLSPQAQALLRYYPLPNTNTGPSRYNYEVPILNATHQDALQARVNPSLGKAGQLSSQFAFQDTRMDNPNVFGFRDATDTLGINATEKWTRRLGHTWSVNASYAFSRQASHMRSAFEDRQNVSGLAGIAGNDQDPMNWGPPSLTFSGGTAGLSDAQSSFNRNQTNAVGGSLQRNIGSHDIRFGVDLRRQQFNVLAQQDPRGTLTFTGAATGSDFADFLLGLPNTTSIAFGNADKYFRQSVYDAYFADEWRMTPDFTLNAGVRWEYGAPITELYSRLVNLDVVPGFTAIAPVVASDPAGPLTRQRYPASLVRPDKSGFEPRVGIAWRPLPASSTVVRAGYGVYYDTSVYETLALQMAQQPPLSKTLSVENNLANPVTLANAFSVPGTATTNTFGLDPNFRVGYAQNWQASVQEDLPWAMQMTALYMGIKGTRGTQEFLPNTYPAGALNACSACPFGFAYLTSNGNSSREAAQISLRRRLRSGFAAQLQYTFAKALDDDSALGGPGPATTSSQSGSQSQNSPEPAAAAVPLNLAIAQNWRDLSAERGRSSFDQRHVLAAQAQYTTGMGIAGGTLRAGWRGTLLNDWTLATQINAGSGLPETPLYLAPVPGTGFTNVIRPDYTGAPLYAAPAGFYLNPAAYTAPAAGQWGNAGRNTITGPVQFTMNASLARTFRVSDHLTLDLRIDSSNPINHVTFNAWNVVTNNTQFGLPAAANSMRTVLTTLRLRF